MKYSLNPLNQITIQEGTKMLMGMRVVPSQLLLFWINPHTRGYRNRAERDRQRERERESGGRAHTHTQRHTHTHEKQQKHAETHFLRNDCRELQVRGFTDAEGGHSQFKLDRGSKVWGLGLGCGPRFYVGFRA